MALSDTVTTTQLSIPSLPRDTSRRWERTYVQAAMLTDAGAAAIAGALAFSYKTSLDTSATRYAMLAALLPVAWVAAIAVAGGYERRFLSIGPEEFRRVALGALGLIALVGTLSWATQADIARRFVVVALPAAAVLTWLARYAIRKHVHAMRKRGAFLHQALVLGDAKGVRMLTQRLHTRTYHGYQVIGACLPTGAQDMHTSGIPVVGTLDSVPHAVSETGADSVIVLASPEMDSDRLRRLAWELEPTGANLVVAPALIEVAGTRMAVRPVEGLPLLHVEHPRFVGVRRLIKSTYEPIVAAVALALLSPLLAVIAVAIKVDSPGPVLFRQTRVGRLGRPFTILKFRSMVTGADQRKGELADLDVGAGPLFKVPADPRVTRVGSFIRRTSLDELPQLVNVLTGRMSLVGPRPHLIEELTVFGEDFSRRLFVKPGITGLWQVSGRSDLSFEESVQLDLRYVENWSFVLDLYIIWKTVWVMAKQSGAY